MAFFDFLTNVPRNGNSVVDFDALQKARKDLIGELDAVIQYDDHIHTSNVEAAKVTWVDIRNEELVHVGELLGLSHTGEELHKSQRRLFCSFYAPLTCRTAQYACAHSA